MLIINKKRITIIVSCLFISLFAFSFKIANQEKQKDETNNTIQTTATPVSGKTIVVDAGHGVPDERCRK